MKTKNLVKFFLIILLFGHCSFAQEYDITPLLNKILAGDVNSVREETAGLKSQYPDDPSILYLDALLIENGEDASQQFSQIAQNYPKSKYADACLFRVYSYNYALGSYKKAQDYLFKLKQDYPNSQYIKIIDNKMDFEETDNTNVEVNNNTSQILYTLQAGAFTNLENAKELKSDLEKDGYKVEIKEKSVGGTAFQVVYVGKYSDEKSAQQDMNKINNDFKLNSRVVQIK
jgi:hypothetical protein